MKELARFRIDSVDMRREICAIFDANGYTAEYTTDKYDIDYGLVIVRGGSGGNEIAKFNKSALLNCITELETNLIDQTQAAHGVGFKQGYDAGYAARDKLSCANCGDIDKPVPSYLFEQIEKDIRPKGWYFIDDEASFGPHKTQTDAEFAYRRHCMKYQGGGA